MSRPLPLVLLPGLNGTGQLFAPLLRDLPAECAVTVISFPPDQLPDYAAFEDWVRPRLPAAGQFVIVAESFSGPLALRLAASRPANLAALILCATFGRPPRPAWLCALVARAIQLPGLSAASVGRAAGAGRPKR